MKNLRKEEIKKLKIPVLAITVTPIETAAFFEKFKYLNGEETKYIAQGQTYNIGYLGNYMVAHIESNMGNLRSNGSMLTTYDGIKDICPQLILMVGIAFGINSDNQKIGDVLISESVFPYELSKVATKDGVQTFIPRGEVVRTSQELTNIFKNYPVDGYSVFSGTLLSGEKLVDNFDYRESLIAFLNNNKTANVVGGEMESVGVSSSAIRTDFPKWIIVKAICDFADGDKARDKTNRQQLAAKRAVEYCFSIFNDDILTRNLKISKISPKFLSGRKIKINGYVLFYYRNKFRLSFRRLSNMVKIKEYALRNYEKVSFNNQVLQFSFASESDIKKLEELFECPNELSKLETNPITVNFYNNNKGKKQFFPVKDFKIVFFDFDGTITEKSKDKSTWQLLWSKLGYGDNECISLHRKYSNKEITHEEWCRLTKVKFIEKGLTKQQVEECAADITILPNVFEVIAELKKRGIKCYIISGSINTVIDYVLGKNTALFDKIVCNKFYYDGDKLDEIVGTRYDFEGKAKFISEIANETNISPKEMLFVGNSNNDEWAYKSGVNTLAVNPKLTNVYDRKTWNYLIGDLKDFKEVLPFVLPETLNR